MDTPKNGLFFVVKRYAVREAKKWRYAVRKAKIGRYAVRKGEGGVTLCHVQPLFKDAMNVSFRSELFTSYILTIFKRRNILL